MFKLKALLVAALCMVAANSYASDNDMDVDGSDSDASMSDSSPIIAPRAQPTAPSQTLVYRQARQQVPPAGFVMPPLALPAAALLVVVAPLPVIAPLPVQRQLNFN